MANLRIPYDWMLICLLNILFNIKLSVMRMRDFHRS